MLHDRRLAMVLISSALACGLLVSPAWAEPDDEGEPLALNWQDSSEQVMQEESTTPVTTAAPAPILWDGFLYGDPYFKTKPRPVGSPLYFEDPFINSDLRFVYLWHDFPKSSQLRGGELNVYALQARLAITDRLQFIATKDGYSQLDTGLTGTETGWNDIAFGLKYALLVDHENDFLLSTGLRWNLSNGHNAILQGNVDELSPFVTAYKGWGKWNFIADVVGRIPMDEHQGNCILSWDAHVDYEIVENFFPLFEVHGLHYLSDGDRLPLDVGGLDYGNIGSAYVAGNAAFWGGVGFRWNITDYLSWGAVYEFPMQTVSSNDIFEQRVTTNVILTF